MVAVEGRGGAFVARARRAGLGVCGGCEGAGEVGEGVRGFATAVRARAGWGAGEQGGSLREGRREQVGSAVVARCGGEVRCEGKGERGREGRDGEVVQVGV